MHVRARGVGAVAAILLVSIVLLACGGGSAPVEVGAGADPSSDPTGDPGAPDPGAAEDPGPTSTEVAPEPPPADAPSPVDGLTADQLRTAVEAPASDAATQARRRGPVAEQVAAGGTTVWRITIPGRFDLISSQIVVAVGGTDVGVGVVTPDLASLVAVTPDGGPLVDGAAVTYRWGAAEPTAAGALRVVR